MEFEILSKDFMDTYWPFLTIFFFELYESSGVLLTFSSTIYLSKHY